MKAAVIEKPGLLAIKDVPIPKISDEEILIRIVASGICGTDIHIFRGEYLGTYPVIPGHEFSGIVEKVGSKVSRFKPGDHVAVEPNIACDNCPACLNNHQNFCENWNGIGVTLPGGMAEYVAVPEKAAFNIGDLPFNFGAFVEPLSCVIHGVERTGFRLGDRVLIIGAGPIGILLSKAIQLQGACEITQVDKNGARLDLARNSGAFRTESSLDAIKKDFFDVVVDATGHPAIMEKTLIYARYGGKVLLFGVPPSNAILTLSAFSIFRKGLTILSSYTSVRNSIQAVRLLSSGKIEVQSLISHELPLNKLEHGIKLIEDGKEGALKILIHPGQ
jgi:2-desacetyl-2-hydroxyethyl bacteriochlorophyllide A dehydrogenase